MIESNRAKHGKVSGFQLLTVFLICIMILALLFVSSGYVIICIQALLVVYISHLSIKLAIGEKSTTELLSDGRFYFIVILCLYSVWGPLLAVLSDVDTKGFKPLGNIAAANTYYTDSIIQSGLINILLFSGLLLGITLRKSMRFQIVKSAQKRDVIECKNDAFSYSLLWLCVAVISTFVFLMPFFRGGFSLISAGYSMVDVYSLGNTSPALLSVLFGPECMTISTIATVYYMLKSGRRRSTAYAFVIVLTALEMIIMFTTSRRARALSIILCSFIMIIGDIQSRGKKLRMIWILLPVGLLAVAYLAESIITYGIDGVMQTESFILYQLSRFDGLGPYETLLNATRQNRDIGILNNVLYGAFRSLLVVGKYIVEFFGIDSSNPPLYAWLATQYPSIYSVGGGLASMPQLEAYLTLGHLGCLIYGMAYGLFICRKRSGLSNYILIPLGFMVARGDIQVLLGLLWSYYVYCYYLYDKIVFRLLINSKKRLWKK